MHSQRLAWDVLDVRASAVEDVARQPLRRYVGESNGELLCNELRCGLYRLSIFSSPDTSLTMVLKPLNRSQWEK